MMKTSVGIPARKGGEWLHGKIINEGRWESLCCGMYDPFLLED